MGGEEAHIEVAEGQKCVRHVEFLATASSNHARMACAFAVCSFCSSVLQHYSVRSKHDGGRALISGIPTTAERGGKIRSGPLVGKVATSPLPSRGSPPLQSGGQNQKWPTCGQSGYVTPAISGIPTASEHGAGQTFPLYTKHPPPRQPPRPCANPPPPPPRPHCRTAPRPLPIPLRPPQRRRDASPLPIPLRPPQRRRDASARTRSPSPAGGRSPSDGPLSSPPSRGGVVVLCGAPGPGTPSASLGCPHCAGLRQEMAKLRVQLAEALAAQTVLAKSAGARAHCAPAFPVRLWCLPSLLRPSPPSPCASVASCEPLPL